MKILFLTNNEISEDLINWLRNEAKEEVIVFNGKISKEDILRYRPNFIISYNYRYIIKEKMLNLLPRRTINLHISFLPWNKGAHPNLWSFLEDTPKGVTIHLMDEGIDTGDILLQREAALDEKNETLLSSYLILHKNIQDLFVSNWDKIKNFQITPKPQISGGSTHYKKDFERIKHILGNEGWNILINELKKRFENSKRESYEY